MRVVHLSDWHGKSQPVPEADIYVVTGDMLPNFPLLLFDVAPPGEPEQLVVWPTNRELVGLDVVPRPQGSFVCWVVDPTVERALQDVFIDRETEVGGFRRHLGSPDALVAVVRGNHDFVDLHRWFTGGPTFEFGVHGDVLEFQGLRLAGLRGINFICGEWCDELTSDEWSVAMGRVPPDCDVLLSHAPPRNVLDDCHGNHYGSDHLAQYVQTRMYRTEQDGARPLRAHLFGHIHESFGSTNIDGTLFSNAATGFLAHDI